MSEAPLLLQYTATVQAALMPTYVIQEALMSLLVGQRRICLPVLYPSHRELLIGLVLSKAVDPPIFITVMEETDATLLQPMEYGRILTEVQTRGEPHTTCE
jgi:hypothetical protein